MITFAKNALLSQDMKLAIHKVSTCTKLNPRVAYKFSRVAHFLDVEARAARKEWVEIAKKYVPVDAQGNFELAEGGQEFKFKEGIDEAAAKEELVKWGGCEVSLAEKWTRFLIDDLAPAELSPLHLAALEPMIEEPAE